MLNDCPHQRFAQALPSMLAVDDRVAEPIGRSKIRHAPRKPNLNALFIKAETQRMVNRFLSSLPFTMIGPAGGFQQRTHPLNLYQFPVVANQVSVFYNAYFRSSLRLSLKLRWNIHLLSLC